MHVRRDGRWLSHRCCRAFLLALLLSPFTGWSQYALHIEPVDADSAFIRNKLGLITTFKSLQACTDYIYNLIPVLQGKGYFTASADSVNYGPAGATVRLFVGKAWRWAYIDAHHVDPTLLAAVAWNQKTFAHHLLDYRQAVPHALAAPGSEAAVQWLIRH